MPIRPILRSMIHNPTRVVLILVEIAMTLAIVTNCVNMILDQRKQMQRPSGFDDANLLFINASPFSNDYAKQPFVTSIIDADLRALQSIPGVRSATNTYFLPWQGGGSSFDVKVPGTSTEIKSQVYPVTPSIFDTLGTRVTEGRGFRAADYDYDPVNGRPNAYVISRALARKAFGNVSAIGKMFVSTDGKRTYPIVGVIDEFYNPYAWGIGEQVLFSPRKNGGSGGMSYLIRTEPGAAGTVLPLIEKRLIAVEPNRVIATQGVPAVKEQFNSNARLVVVTMSVVIVLLLFVTALGMVGLAWLSVTERTRQIGTRRALGATRSNIVNHFLIENWLVTTAGLVVGAGAAFALNIFLVSRFADVKLGWPLVAVGMAMLWLTGLLATLPPAVRASRLSPAIATRSV